MAPKIDIFGSAERLVEAHGEDASIFAAMEADSCLENGDHDGKVAWLKVIEVIKILQAASAPTYNPTTH